jgi:methylenetetrahydrofolate reductase (NADPH)
MSRLRLPARATNRRRLAEMAARMRYEVIPSPTIEEDVRANVPADVPVAVTASPTKGLETTLELSERLSAAGYRVVPHVSARLLRDGAHLAEVVERLRAAGIDDVFMPAGDSEVPAGAYESALPALVELSRLPGRFSRVGITGYPQSHPRIIDDVTIQAMWDKRLYADYIVSNMCFDAAVLGTWIKRVRSRGVSLPLLVGIAGPVDTAKLLSMSRKIGVSEATRFAGRHLGATARLAAPGGYEPGRLLERMTPSLLDPASGVEGLHVFTFNQLKATEAWRQSLLSAS